MKQRVKDAMPFREEEKMVNTISRVLKDMEKGNSPEDAVVSAAIDLKLSPTQTARVCEACNKMSAIRNLSVTDPARKQTAFALADPVKVAARLKAMDKAEHAPVNLPKTASEGLYQTDVEHGLRKTLGVTSLDRANLLAADIQGKLASAPAKIGHLCDMHGHAKIATARAEARYQDAFADLLVSVEKATLKQASDLARYLSNGGSLEKRTLRMLVEHLPVYKEASINLTSAWAPTGSLLERKAERFIKAAGDAVAARDAEELAAKEALDLLNASLNTVDLLRSLKSDDKASTGGTVYDNPFSVSTTNRINELALKDSFANMYLDDEFLLQYEPKIVLDAYNKVLQMYPGLHSRQNADALVTAMVKKMLTAGNQIDPLEIPATTKMEKEMAEARKNQDVRAWE